MNFTRRVRFEEISIKGMRRWKDPVTGRPRQESRKFSQTLNPFNKLADGSPKTREDIMAELKAQRLRWLASEPT